MRVALVAHRLPEGPPTGVERVATELGRSLATGHPALELAWWSAREPGGAASVAGVPVRRFPLDRRLLHGAWCATGRPSIDRWVGAVDLVHIVSPSMPVPTRRPLVVTIHDVMPIRHPDWFGPWHRRSYALMLRTARRHAAAVIAPTSTTARDLAELGFDAALVTVLPLGVDRRFLDPVDPSAVAAACRAAAVEPGGFWLFIGAVSPRKNLGVVVDALARLPGAGRLPLVVAGGGTEGLAALRARAASHGIADLVHPVGRCDDAELRALLAAARGLVHPSRAEGFGLTTLEAMATGTPVIAAAAGALVDTVEGRGQLVDPDDAVAWAAAMGRVLDGDPAVAAAVEAGRRWAGSRTWTAYADGVVAVYREVTARAL